MAAGRKFSPFFVKCNILVGPGKIILARHWQHVERGQRTSERCPTHTVIRHVILLNDTLVSFGFFAPCFSSLSTVHSSAETEIVHIHIFIGKKKGLG
jgi:hypothetical protein